MLCLYSPYSFSRARGGVRDDPALGIFRTVCNACANTLSAFQRQRINEMGGKWGV